MISFLGLSPASVETPCITPVGIYLLLLPAVSLQLFIFIFCYDFLVQYDCFSF